jgi:hypothetical protein
MFFDYYSSPIKHIGAGTYPHEWFNPLPRRFSMGESSVQRYSLDTFYLPCQPFSSYFLATIFCLCGDTENDLITTKS